MRSTLAIIIFIVMSAIVVLGAATNAYAAYAYDNEDYHCDVAVANDLHITYYSDTKMRLIEHYDNGFPNFSATASPDSSTWECTWSGQTVVYCTWVHVGAKFWQQAKNYLAKKNIYWTLNGTNVSDLAGPGFEVTPPMGTGTLRYRVINSTTESITLTGLTFRTSATETPLPSMMFPVGGTGWDTPRSPIVVPPESFFDVYLDVTMTPPFFLMAQGTVEQGGVEVGHFVQQHEHPEAVPTLNQWGMILLLVLLLASATLVIRRRARSSVA
jgi:hypothetical protein